MTQVKTKTIKVGSETYGRLCEVAGELQKELKRPISLEEAVKHLISLRERGVKITDLAGSWEITDEELTEIKHSLTEAWRRWRSPKL